MSAEFPLAYEALRIGSSEDDAEVTAIALIKDGSCSPEIPVIVPGPTPLYSENWEVLRTLMWLDSTSHHAAGAGYLSIGVPAQECPHEIARQASFSVPADSALVSLVVEQAAQMIRQEFGGAYHVERTVGSRWQLGDGRAFGWLMLEIWAANDSANVDFFLDLTEARPKVLAHIRSDRFSELLPLALFRPTSADSAIALASIREPNARGYTLALVSATVGVNGLWSIRREAPYAQVIDE